MVKHRASRISAHQSTDHPSGCRIWLMQWHFSERINDRFGESIRYSFRSIVTRPGRLGLYLDLPYYCYAGEHRYKRLPAGLTLRVVGCIVRGYVHDVMFRLRERVRLGWWAAVRAVRSIPDTRRQRKASKEFRKFWGLDD